MLTYQTEHFDKCIADIRPLWAEQAKELVGAPIAANEGLYAQLQVQGRLQVATVRADGALVGYHMTFVNRDHQRVSRLLGAVDCYFLDPVWRKGRVGINLLKFAEKALKRRGVTAINITTTLRSDKARVLDYLGYTEIERVFTKELQ